ncbi:hypothetical protein BJV74DRAFT_304530 [Russula compacta]|nr:hypothetical protein BJV74DRAFT_304530 [Russula compacta]
MIISSSSLSLRLTLCADFNRFNIIPLYSLTDNTCWKNGSYARRKTNDIAGWEWANARTSQT